METLETPGSFNDFVEARGLQDKSRAEAVDAYTIVLADYHQEAVSQTAESGTVPLLHYTPAFMKKIIERSQAAA